MENQKSRKEIINEGKRQRIGQNLYGIDEENLQRKKSDLYLNMQLDILTDIFNYRVARLMIIQNLLYEEGKILQDNFKNLFNMG